jgi:hypothetical protein
LKLLTMKKYFFLFWPLFFLLSCSQVTLMQQINSEQAEIVQFRNKDKVVEFIPMHHIGKPLFYVDVRLLVDSFKKDGFIVFYESARSEYIEDSVVLDHYQRKLRKMLGVHIDSSGYAKHLPQTAFFKDLINQPPYEELGLSETDIRVDIPNNKLVDAYEQKFGPIELVGADLDTPLGDKYNQALRLPKKNVMYVIIDYRNMNLARYINASPYKKILVIYGALHMQGTFDELNNLDHSWQKKQLKKVKMKKVVVDN